MSPDTSSLAGQIERYEAYIKADPSNAHLWLSLGDLYHRAGRFDEAIASFEKCLQHSPAMTTARSRIASVLISRHQFREAEQQLRALIQEGETDAALYHNLGLALMHQQRWTDAKDAFQGAIAAGLRHGDCHAHLARALHHLGDMSGAIEQCQRWVEMAKDSTSEGYLALLHMDQGDMAKAFEIAKHVLATAPDNTHAGLVAGTASVEEQQMDAASNYFEAILRREPRNARAWLGTGLVRLYQQRNDEALRYLKEAVKLMPTSSGAIVALGWAQLAGKDLRGAEQTFRDAVAVDRNFAESHGGLATALALQGKPDAARGEIVLATRLDPRGFGAAFAQVVILKMQGHKNQAVDLLAKLLQQSPRPGGRSLVEEIDIFLRKTRSAAPPVPPPGNT